MKTKSDEILLELADLVEDYLTPTVSRKFGYSEADFISDVISLYNDEVVPYIKELEKTQ